jgi:penicillin G amidase
MDRAVTAPGLDAEVVVLRDELGIPHVRATTAHDAFFGQGLVQAQDRLGQLEYDRRRAYGRWAEVAGPSAVPFDAFVRRCDLDASARREYEELAPDARSVLDSFAAGVNAWLALGEPLPLDLERAGVRPASWSPWDCCAVFLVRHVVFASWQKKLFWGRLAHALGPETVARVEGADPRAVPLIVPPDAVLTPRPLDATGLDEVADATAPLESGAASNAWGLDGSRTASGLPMLAGDPHRLVEVPGVYAQVHLACPEFDAAGLSFVGVPGFPHFGCNERVAWCVTNANGDYQDLYVERFDAAPEAVRCELIHVRGGPDVQVECHETRHGPVVFGDPATGYAVALRTTTLVEPSSGLEVLLPMLRARDVDELDDVMRAWVDPVNNFLSADADGNLAYRTVGRIPVRAPANAWGPVPGWLEGHEWSGMVPYDDMPRVRNPDCGLIVTANQRIVADDFPHHIGVDYGRPDRAVRLHARLDDLGDARVSDMAAVHRDVRSLPADIWVDRLLRLEPVDEHERAALDVLRAWDREMTIDAPGAAVYVAVRDAVGRHVAHHPALAALRAPLPDEPPVTFHPLELRCWQLLTGCLAGGDETLLPPGSSWDEVLAVGLSDGVAVLRAGRGDDPSSWRWGALHRAAPQHPLSRLRPEWAERLDPPSVEIAGYSDTVFSTGHLAGFGFTMTSGSVARYVFDLSDRRNNQWVVPLGAAGDPTSPHFADQQRRWADGELFPMQLSWDDLAANGDATVLRPA